MVASWASLRSALRRAPTDRDSSSRISARATLLSGHCLSWAQLLFEKGLHPATRVGMMVCVRKYIEWLWETGVTTAPGRELIRGSDLPIRPGYLPRPLPADSDRELQQKLKDDESKVGLGLYVMR